MSNLIMKTTDLKDGYTEIAINAIDDIRDCLMIYQKGNTYTDDGYTEFNLITDILWDQDKISTKLAKTLKSIANHWGCDFNDDHEFITTNGDRDQALINLTQCISSAIGYCWALHDVQRSMIMNSYNQLVPGYVKDRINYFNKLFQENIISFACAMEMILAYDEDQCIDDFMIGCDKPWLAVTDEFKKWRDTEKNLAAQQVAFRLLFCFNDDDLIHVK